MEATARHSRQGNADFKEMTIKKGEPVLVLKHQKDWCWVLVRDDEGWVPTNRLNILPCNSYEGSQTKEEMEEKLAIEADGSCRISYQPMNGNFCLTVKNGKKCNTFALLRNKSNNYTVFSNVSFKSVTNIGQELITEEGCLNFKLIHTIEEMEAMKNLVTASNKISQLERILERGLNGTDLTTMRPSLLGRLEDFFINEGQLSEKVIEKRGILNYWSNLNCDIQIRSIGNKEKEK